MCVRETVARFFLSFFLGFRRPNLITGLSGWRTPDSSSFLSFFLVRGQDSIFSNRHSKIRFWCDLFLSPSFLTLLQSYRPKICRGVWIFTKLFGPPPRIWILYARKMIGGMSQKNTFLLTTYVNMMPVLPLLARRMLTAGARANTSLFCSARKMRNFTTSFESIWSCPSL